MKWVLVFTMVFCITSYSMAQYNPGKLGEGAGAYMYAVCLANELNNSKCNYLFKKTVPLQPVINDIESHLKEGDLLEFRGFTKEMLKNMQHNANKFISEFMDISTKNGEIDTRTACGMLVQNIAIQLGIAKQKWEEAKRLYSE